MNWYSLYVDGNETYNVLTFHSAHTEALPYIRNGQVLRIQYGAPERMLRVWRFDYAADAWLDGRTDQEPGSLRPEG